MERMNEPNRYESSDNQDTKEGLYKRFMNSRAFYPVVLSLIAALCVSIWAIQRSNKMLDTTLPITQNNVVTAGDYLDEPTTAVQNTTAAVSATETTTEKSTYAYEENKAFEGKWVMPLSGSIGKDFSAGKLIKSATMGDYRVHDGIDIIAKQGTTVVAVNAGKVLDIYNDAFWGMVIVIDHGDDVIGKYCGLQKDTAVEKNQVVDRGTVLGKLGSVPCEQKDESHLHLELSRGGEVQDPIAVMNLNNTSE